MLKMIKAEHIKSCHTLGKHLPVIFPVFTLLLVFCLMRGNMMPEGTWNWWYAMLLPGMLAILCHLGMKKERKMHYFNLYCLSVPVSRYLMCKMIYWGFYLLLANFLIFIGTWIAGDLFGTTISVMGGFWGFVLLTITYLWEIPLCMLLSSRFGMFISIFSCMVLTIGSVVAIAHSRLWWVLPSAVPIRLMCPVLGVMPNGLLAPEGSKLLDTSVIYPGILISLAWFVLLSWITIFWFERKVVKG